MYSIYGAILWQTDEVTFVAAAVASTVVVVVVVVVDIDDVLKPAFSFSVHIVCLIVYLNVLVALAGFYSACL